MSLTSISIVPQNGNSSVLGINCGKSDPKLGGTISLSAYTNLVNFVCVDNDITEIKGYNQNNNFLTQKN